MDDLCTLRGEHVIGCATKSAPAEDCESCAAVREDARVKALAFARNTPAWSKRATGMNWSYER